MINRVYECSLTFHLTPDGEWCWKFSYREDRQSGLNMIRHSNDAYWFTLEDCALDALESLRRAGVDLTESTVDGLTQDEIDHLINVIDEAQPKQKLTKPKKYGHLSLVVNNDRTEEDGQTRKDPPM